MSGPHRPLPGVRRRGRGSRLCALDYAVLHNPVAGRGQASRVAEGVVARLRSAGHQVVAGHSEGPGDLERISRELGDGVERVLVLGGDGSLREVAAGQLARPSKSRVEIGVLPFGSGNVVARELGLPLDPMRAVDAIAESPAHPWDVGWARADGGEREPFLAMAGAGYDAAIAERVTAARKKEGGARWYRSFADSLYVWVGVSEMFRLRPPRFALVIDGERVAERAVAAVVSNTQTYAKRMQLNPGARPDDGVFDVNLRTGASALHAATALVAARLSPPGPSWAVTTHTGRSIELWADGEERPFPWQADGDAMGRAHALEIDVDPGALRLVGVRVGSHKKAASAPVPRHDAQETP